MFMADVSPLRMKSPRTASAIIYLVYADVGAFNNNRSNKRVILNNDNRWSILLAYVTSQVKHTLSVLLMKGWLTAVRSSSLPTGVCQKSGVRRWSRSGILLGDCLSAQSGLHLQPSTISIRKSNRVCIHLHYHLPHHNLSWAFSIVLISIASCVHAIMTTKAMWLEAPNGFTVIDY